MNRIAVLKTFFSRALTLPLLCALSVFLLTRLVLFGYAISFSDQSWESLLTAVFYGSLRDLPIALAISAPWLLFEALPGILWRQYFQPFLFFIFVFTLLFVAVSEIIFWDEFSTRFNFIAVDYLIYTTEVIGNIKESYPVRTILSAIISISLVVTWLLRHRLFTIAESNKGQVWHNLIISIGGLFIFILAASALNATDFSRNSYANELADNGWRSFVSAARQNKLDYKSLYATRPDTEVLADLAQLSGKDELRATHLPSPPVRLAKQNNVIVLMMESMSAEYMATFGNRENLTPNLDRLAQEGILFSQLYATGTRTVRGLEALSAALPPQPGMSVVRWPNITNLNTLGSVLGDQGWQTHFIYGGYGAFDNMNSYFDAQGYKVTDRTNFKEGLVKFENVWGVADEHLFDQALIEFDKDHSAGHPFFAHIMTTSNHRPFTYPDGRIDIPSHSGRKGGVKYADYAIGRFIEMAKNKPWFENTIFLIVADHCASSAGKAKIPVSRYHIPAIIYAPQFLTPRQVDTLSSQIDLVPTLLSLLGLGNQDHFVGRDILKTSPSEGRALMSTYQNLGYLKGDQMIVLQPKRKIEAFSVSSNQKDAQSIPVDSNLANQAIAYFQGASLLMEKHQKLGK